MPHTHDIEIRGDVVRKTFVSWSDGEPEREWSALVLLHDRARGLGPEPLARLAVDDRPAVTMTRVAGEPLSGTLDPRRVRALAQALRRLFAVPVPTDLPARANGPAVLAALSRDWLTHAADWHRCQDPTLVRRAVAVACRWLDQHPVADDWLVEPVVALGDGNLDNVLWDGEVCRLVDWEEFGVSDLAHEVADVVEHASSRLGRRLDVDALLRDLAPDAARRERVEQHRRRFACFWLAMLLPGNRGWARNPPGSTEDQARHVLALVGAGSAR